jgi:hypothetical protein
MSWPHRARKRNLAKGRVTRINSALKALLEEEVSGLTEIEKATLQAASQRLSVVLTNWPFEAIFYAREKEAESEE